MDIRILFLDINVEYFNKTRNLFLNIIKGYNDVKLFGPGYLYEKNLKNSLSYIKNNLSKFDLIISNEHIIFSECWKNYEMLSRGYKKYYTCFFQIHEIRYLKELFEIFKNANNIKIVSLLESDFYNFSNRQIELLECIPDYLITWGEEFLAPIDTLPNIKNEFFYKYVNDNYYNFTKQNKNKIISIPHCVSEFEFAWHPIENRKYDWMVPGVKYWARKTALYYLKKNKIKYKRSYWPYLYSFLNKLGFDMYSHLTLSRLYNILFQNSLKSSKYAYTCGSGLNYPIRKFFEIPALGTVLVCMPCNGFGALGFKDKVNAITCMPNEIPEIHEFLKNNPEKAQEIADAGRELIWQKHTTRARSLQLYGALSAIKERNFFGSYWHEGDFYILKKNSEGNIVPVLIPSIFSKTKIQINQNAETLNQANS
ncbi:MAG: glycosyltransferase [Candidatus Nanoarchaeia archaeon]|nr:glycosyltransferase [Candidatus Jingweiarchaeum tengchongense]